jgi:hypothetical protein
VQILAVILLKIALAQNKCNGLEPMRGKNVAGLPQPCRVFVSLRQGWET